MPLNHTKCILLCALLFILAIVPSFSQPAGEGRFVSDKFTAPSLSGNSGGENPVRRLSIYLPPGYDAGKQRYPVIYFLHGFGVNDSLMVVWFQLKEVMDKGIREKRIPPVILVVPDCESRYFGAFYTNSEVNGNWGDFISHDVVNYVDTHYRTLSRKENRGLCGHSMGGNGIMRIVMQYPNIFHAAYALSPGALHWSHEFNLNNQAFKKLSELTDEKDILRLDEDPTVDPLQFWIPLIASLGRSFSPDVNSKPHLGRLPVSYEGKKRVIHPAVLSSWEEKFPINMAHRYVDALKSLRGLKIDWGRNDEFPHIPATCRELSMRLEALGIPHEAEEYIGGHVDKVGGDSGRIVTEVLPSFATLLEFK